jgi:hypothetical protein
VFCSQDISQITVSNVLGGTGAYTHVVAGSATAPLAGAGNNPVLSVDKLTNLSWDVYVKDANGCIDAKCNCGERCSQPL